LVLQNRSAEADSHFDRSLESILEATNYLEYRHACLRAAAEY